jgi:hypothetical protein
LKEYREINIGTRMDFVTERTVSPPSYGRMEPKSGSKMVFDIEKTINQRLKE